MKVWCWFLTSPPSSSNTGILLLLGVASLQHSGKPDRNRGVPLDGLEPSKPHPFQGCALPSELQRLGNETAWNHFITFFANKCIVLEFVWAIAFTMIFVVALPADHIKSPVIFFRIRNKTT